MIHTHHESQVPGTPETPETLASGGHCERCASDLSFVAYVVGASVMIGAILISASLFYNVRLILRSQTGSQAVVAAANGQGTTPTAPTTPTTPQAPQAPTGPVNITLKANTPFLGAPNAKVTVVEYADYE